MQCKELMTENPMFCLPTDTAANVAQLMKDADIGAVPVVLDADTKKLIGIVTDRDLAMRVDGADLDPDTTLTAEVMTRGLVTCAPEDDSQKVLHAMEKYQIRRIPIVDAEGLLVGIIAQADIARHLGDPEKVTRLITEVSRPAGEAEKAACLSNWRTGLKYCKTGALVAGSIGGGAALMYLLDPARGKARRRQLLDRAQSACRQSGKLADQIKHDIANRARGVAAETKSFWRHEIVPDEKLLGRVRTKLGRWTSHPHAIDVRVERGRVILGGPILADEVERLLAVLARIPGVTNVENRLEMHASAEGVPMLQGGKPKRKPTNWKPFLRVLGMIGMALLARAESKEPAPVEKRAETHGKSRVA
jgi:CBS domain-containing protein